MIGDPDVKPVGRRIAKNIPVEIAILVHCAGPIGDISFKLRLMGKDFTNNQIFLICAHKSRPVFAKFIVYIDLFLVYHAHNCW